MKLSLAKDITRNVVDKKELTKLFISSLSIKKLKQYIYLLNPDHDQTISTISDKQQLQQILFNLKYK